LRFPRPIDQTAQMLLLQANGQAKCLSLRKDGQF